MTESKIWEMISGLSKEDTEKFIMIALQNDDIETVNRIWAGARIEANR